MNTRASLFLAPLLLSSLACGSSDAPDAPDTGEPGSPAVNKIAGSYEVTSTYDLSASAGLPTLVASSLGTLEQLADNPGATLLEVLKSSDANVSEAIDSMPDDLHALLVSEINSYVGAREFQDQLVEEQMIAIVDLVSQTLTSFEMVTTLEAGAADEAGNSIATHSLAALAFEADGRRSVVVTADIATPLGSAADIDMNTDLGAKTVVVGDHGLQLPLGEFAVVGYGDLLQSSLGATDLGEALNTIVDCSGMASQLAPLCMGDVCLDSITNEAEIRDLCAAGLNRVADDIDRGIRGTDFTDLHLLGGEASLTLADDGSVATMSGTWTSEYGVQGEATNTTSSFEAARIR